MDKNVHLSFGLSKFTIVKMLLTFSEVLPLHRDQDHAYRPDSCGAILDLFRVCLSRRAAPPSTRGLNRLTVTLMSAGLVDQVSYSE